MKIRHIKENGEHIISVDLAPMEKLFMSLEYYRRVYSPFILGTSLFIPVQRPVFASLGSDSEPTLLTLYMFNFALGVTSFFALLFLVYFLDMLKKFSIRISDDMISTNWKSVPRTTTLRVSPYDVLIYAEDRKLYSNNFLNIKRDNEVSRLLYIHLNELVKVEPLPDEFVESDFSIANWSEFHLNWYISKEMKSLRQSLIHFLIVYPLVGIVTGTTGLELLLHILLPLLFGPLVTFLVIVLKKIYYRREMSSGTSQTVPKCRYALERNLA